MQSAISTGSDFDNFIASLLPKGHVVHFKKKQIIFSHGERSDSIFYIQKGYVKLTATSKRGKEAIVGIFDAGELFGESCIDSDKPARFHTATALTDMSVVKIRCNIIRLALGEGNSPSYGFIVYLLKRYARIQQNLVSNLLESSQERLARLLFSLHSGEPGKGASVPRLTQQDLAEMIGTTRQQVNVLINRSRNVRSSRKP